MDEKNACLIVNKNHGVLVAPPRPTDYLAGVSSPIQVVRAITDWNPFLPDVENQFSSVTDFLDCTTFSGAHDIEANINYLLATKQLPDEAVNFINDNHFMQNGKFRLSVRASAKMNGTDKTRGQYLNIAADHFRNDGLAPDTLWPMGAHMTWDEYYTEVPQAIKDLAKKILWFIKIQTQGVNQVDIPSFLKLSPIQVATAVCPGWDSGKVVQKCSGQPLQHATMIYGISLASTYQDFDHYPPYKQELASDYELPLNMQYIVSVKPLALRNGMHGANVLQMQHDLYKLGYIKTISDSFFGPITEGIVKKFQTEHGLVADGIAGPTTLALIKSLLTSQTVPTPKLDLWCAAIKKMEGALPSRNNPGNLRYVGQQYAVNDRGFCKFDTYEHGYQALRTLIINACTGKYKMYNANGNLYDFYKVYAPDSDGNNSKQYAEFVAKKIGVSPETIIKTLI